MSVLFFETIGRKAIWGHTLVRDYFGYDHLPEGIGQTWAFSTQESASNVCTSEPFKGLTLRDLWNDHQELFGHPNENFPVIISLVGPEDDLSIQIHPDSKVAQKYGYPMGKNEAWYFLDSEPGANIVYGNNAKDKEDLLKYIEEDRWMELIKHYDVHKGTFVYIPAGLLHALKKGSVVYEIQQATDVTYRFFDYHRKDANGNERELHVDKAVECVKFEPGLDANDIHPVTTALENGQQTVFISNDSFTVTRLQLTGKNNYCCDNYQLATVCAGKGTVDGTPVKKGDSFLIPCKTPVVLDGEMLVMMTTK